MLQDLIRNAFMEYNYICALANLSGKWDMLVKSAVQRQQVQRAKCKWI